MTRGSLVCVALAASSLLFPADASPGQVPPSPRPASSQNVAPAAAASPDEAYGLGSQTTIIPVSAFMPSQDGYQFFIQFGDTLTPKAVNSYQRWFVPVDLPSGAVVDTADVFVVDNDPNLDVQAITVAAYFPVTGSGLCGSLSYAAGNSAAFNGQGHIVIANPWAGNPMTGRKSCSGVDSYVSYQIYMEMTSTDQALSGVRLVWHRTVSPAPGMATFGDVPTNHPYFKFVEALVAAGITAGCGSGNYCPDKPISRGEMAVFLSAALGLHWPQ